MSGDDAGETALFPWEVAELLIGQVGVDQAIRLMGLVWYIGLYGWPALRKVYSRSHISRIRRRLAALGVEPTLVRWSRPPNSLDS